jgi:hypothetical protein
MLSMLSWRKITAITVLNVGSMIYKKCLTGKAIKPLLIKQATITTIIGI